MSDPNDTLPNLTVDTGTFVDFESEGDFVPLPNGQAMDPALIDIARHDAPFNAQARALMQELEELLGEETLEEVFDDG